MLDAYQQAFREVSTRQERLGFRYHLLTYLLFNAVFLVVDVLLVPGSLWFPFPLLGWGCGIVAHYLFSVRFHERILARREAEALRRAGRDREP